MRGDRLAGIVTRTNLVQAVLDLAREVPDPTADDDHIRDRIHAVIEKNDWKPSGFAVVVRNGIVHLSGIITDERSRQATIVAAENVSGVRKVHDHLVWIEPMSGVYLNCAAMGQRGIPWPSRRPAAAPKLGRPTAKAWRDQHRQTTSRRSRAGPALPSWDRAIRSRCLGF
jgi:hypothetical protein